MQPFLESISQNDRPSALRSKTMEPQDGSLTSHRSESSIRNTQNTKADSLYHRHTQSELNLHTLENEDRYISSRVASPILRPKRPYSYTPLKMSFMPSGATVSGPSIISGGTESITNIPNGPAPAPRNDIYSNGVFALSDGFVQNGRRYSMLPAVVTASASTCPLLAHQLGHWRSLSLPNLPIFEGTPSNDHALYSISEVEQPRWPPERFYAKYRRSSSETSRTPPMQTKQKRVHRAFRKVYRFFSPGR